MSSFQALQLTDKQRETVEMLASGYTSKHAAAQLGISPQAVDRRVQGLLRKTGCTDRGELIRWHLQCSGLSPAAETNLGTPPEAAASSISERFTAETELCDRVLPHRSSLQPDVSMYPETRLSSARAGAPIEWLGMEVTWLQAILSLMVLRELYEILG